MIFLAKLKEKGELDFGSDFNYARWVEFCRLNKDKTVRVELPQSKRTLSQNAFYWVYLTIISRETGNSEDDLNELFKRKFLPRKVIKIKGKKTMHQFTKLTSTTELSKIEFGEYLDKISAFTDVPLPDPIQAGYFK